VKEKRAENAQWTLADPGCSYAVEEDGGNRARDRIGLPNITVCSRPGSTPTIAFYPKIAGPWSTAC
jgi:hypothetical protein